MSLKFEPTMFRSEKTAREIFEEVALGEEFPAFLTVPAYERYLHEKREELVAA